MADIQITYNFGTYIFKTVPIYYASLVFAMCGNNKKKKHDWAETDFKSV